jgi:hypothetical protein
MSPENWPNRFLRGFLIGAVIFFIGNVFQIGYEYANSFGRSFSYGYPFPFYEYWDMLNRGRFLVAGLIANILVALAFSSLVGMGQHLYYKHYKVRPLSILE